eukprot:3422414-Pleurochrysis_carterae.AAC.1
MWLVVLLDGRFGESSSLTCLGDRSVAAEAAAMAVRLATACAIRRLRSGGYAACEADSHPFCPWVPPTRAA